MGPMDRSYSRACVTITSFGVCFVSKQLASTSFRRQVLSTQLVQRWRGLSGNVWLSNLLISSCFPFQEIPALTVFFESSDLKSYSRSDINNNDKSILLLHPVFLSDVLSDVIGWTFKCSADSALSNSRSNSA